MEKELINHILESLKEDYKIGNCYREDSVKACLYFSIKNFYLEKNKQKKIFIYPEVRNIGDSAVYKKRFDLVISNNKFTNGDNNTIVGFDESNKDIIEIKYIKGTENQIVNSLENDFKKLLEVEEKNIKSKNIFFIYEYFKRDDKYVKNVKNKILEIGENKENTKINIFGLFVDLPDTELKKNLEIEFFKN